MNQKLFQALTVKQLRQAIAIKGKIGRLETQLSRLLGGSAPSANHGDVRKKKRRMSAAGRARISRAAKARWAKIRATKKAAGA